MNKAEEYARLLRLERAKRVIAIGQALDTATKKALAEAGIVLGSGLDRTVEDVQREVCEALLHIESSDCQVRCLVCSGTGLGGASVVHTTSCAFAKLLQRWGVPVRIE